MWAPLPAGGPPGAGTNAGVFFTALSADGKGVACGGAEERDREITGTAHVWRVEALAKATSEDASANRESEKAPAVVQGKDAAKQIDVSKELDKLKGVWVCVGYERDGVEHLDQQAREAMWNETLWFHSGPPKGD